MVAEDGYQALKILQDQSFDLIFMDINMPGIDGYETTRRIRAGGNTLPIIALTATTMKALNAPMLSHVVFVESKCRHCRIPMVGSPSAGVT